jgi:hypothetical protein
MRKIPTGIRVADVANNALPIDRKEETKFPEGEGL